MTFRTKLLIVSAATAAAAVAIVGLVAGAAVQQAFDRTEEQRVAATLEQFRREMSRQEAGVVRQVERLAESGSIRRLALELNRGEADLAAYVNEAAALASSLDLDLASIVAGDGAIISSAHWPARFGYKDETIARLGQSGELKPVLRLEELPGGVVLALVAVRTVRLGDRHFFVAAGTRLDSRFLASLPKAEGVRVLLYQNSAKQFDPALLRSAIGGVEQPESLRSLIESSVRSASEQSFREADRSLHTIPLRGHDRGIAGVLLIETSRQEAVALQKRVLWTAIAAVLASLALGCGLAWWSTNRITRPVNKLAEASSRVAAGDWNARVEIETADEIGALAAAFNQMTAQLVGQRERLVQAERVAAWRELARRLAHELKNPLFPLQITVENMRRARDRFPDQFDGVFQEGTQTLLAEIANLRNITGRFSDFAKMPPPEKQMVHLNDVVTAVERLVSVQLESRSIEARWELDAGLPKISIDPEQIKRAIQNLVLNAIDAMPSGGRLTVRTARKGSTAVIEVSDTGAGLTPEECARLFTPYYTTKQHGTGLGLAIVQSVVSDHGGKVSVAGAPGHGASFCIELEITNGESSDH
jgi:signal transduction histidine kinase